MEWCFKLPVEGETVQKIVKVPDGAFPPSVGETLHLSGEYAGSYRVAGREFQARLPSEDLDGNLLYGWAFSLEEPPQ